MLKNSIIPLSIILGITGISLMTFFKSLEQSFIFFPQKLPSEYKYNFPYPFEEINLTMNDKEIINCLYFPLHKLKGLSQPKGILIYFHGNAGSLDGWGWIAEDFLPFGWDLFIMDYRGFGKSTGKPHEVSLHSDAKEIYQYLKNRFLGKEILPYGRSIGTGIAAKLALEENTPRLILETPYTSFLDLARIYYLFLPSFLLSYRLETYYFVKRYQGKTLVLHGDRDEIIPVSMAREFKKLGNKIKYTEINGGSHNNLSDFPLWKESLKSFLE